MEKEVLHIQKDVNREKQEHKEAVDDVETQL